MWHWQLRTLFLSGVEHGWQLGLKPHTHINFGRVLTGQIKKHFGRAHVYWHDHKYMHACTQEHTHTHINLVGRRRGVDSCVCVSVRVYKHDDVCTHVHECAYEQATKNKATRRSSIFPDQGSELNNSLCVYLLMHMW